MGNLDQFVLLTERLNDHPTPRRAKAGKQRATPGIEHSPLDLIAAKVLKPLPIYPSRTTALDVSLDPSRHLRKALCFPHAARPKSLSNFRLIPSTGLSSPFPWRFSRSISRSSLRMSIRRQAASAW